MDKRRRLLIASAALIAVTAVARHPSADLVIETHAAGDPAPARFRAALDLGLASASILVTWTAGRLVRR